MQQINIKNSTINKFSDTKPVAITSKNFDHESFADQLKNISTNKINKGLKSDRKANLAEEKKLEFKHKENVNNTIEVNDKTVGENNYLLLQPLNISMKLESNIVLYEQNETLKNKVNDFIDSGVQQSTESVKILDINLSKMQEEQTSQISIPSQNTNQSNKKELVSHKLNASEFQLESHTKNRVDNKQKESDILNMLNIESRNKALNIKIVENLDQNTHGDITLEESEYVIKENLEQEDFHEDIKDSKTVESNVKNNATQTTSDSSQSKKKEDQASFANSQSFIKEEQSASTIDMLFTDILAKAEKTSTSSINENITISSINKSNIDNNLEVDNFKISKVLARNEHHIEVSLTPENLGKINIKIEGQAEGISKLIVSADSKETLNLLSENIKELHRELNEIGIKTDSNSTEFNLNSQNQSKEKEEPSNIFSFLPYKEYDGVKAENKRLDAISGYSGIVKNGKVDLKV